MTVSRPLGVFQNESLNTLSHYMLLLESKRIFCRAGSALFTLNTTYTNGSRDFTYSTQYIGPLRDIMAQQGLFAPTNATDLSSIYNFQQTTQYSVGQVMNLFAVIDSMFVPLTGNYPARAVPQGTEFDYTNSSQESCYINGSMIMSYHSDFDFYDTLSTTDPLDSRAIGNSRSQSTM
jgi:hypothetical protein